VSRGSAEPQLDPVQVRDHHHSDHPSVSCIREVPFMHCQVAVGHMTASFVCGCRLTGASGRQRIG
jgi:hypothetical protein